MSNAKESRTAAAQAAEWFVDLQAPDISRDRQEAFAGWLRRSPVHVEEFLQLTALQGDLARLSGLKQLDIASLLATVAANDSNENIVSLQSTPHQTVERESRKAFGLKWLAAAAALLLATFLSADRIREFLGTERYETAVGEQRSLVLADGSHVKLNVHSALTTHVDEAVRDVRLEGGEALFQVAKDPSRPFRVHTPEATIEAKGTQFNVHVRNGETAVALLEGRVVVQSINGEAPVTLVPGQEVTVGAGRGVLLQPRNADLLAVTAWTEHRLVFEDAPLAEVVAEFNRYSRQPLVIDDPVLAATRITASFDAGNAQTFAATLAAAGRLRVTRRSDGTWLIGRR